MTAPCLKESLRVLAEHFVFREVPEGRRAKPLARADDAKWDYEQEKRICASAATIFVHLAENITDRDNGISWSSACDKVLTMIGKHLSERRIECDPLQELEPHLKKLIASMKESPRERASIIYGRSTKIKSPD